ncbi:MAG: phosphoribosylamine--glycine ligase [Chitinispirillia bacterium]|nr:phosphoribosylamine--glycine ligase [Chitinispirillia bacterium]MCL2268977.1 phosphoribosylamine--glycine ligase [Chitinispirillia bacterium]
MDSVLIVGGGGREHALLEAMLRSDRPLCMYAYPGNPGMERDGCMLVDQEISNWEDLADWAKLNEIDLTVVGPEAPLVDGIVDTFKKQGLLAFGPSAAAARIEGSKEFSKNLMKKYGIPTAAFEVFTDKAKALAYAEKKGTPIVIKVSGLAAGKGAIICETQNAAKAALVDIFDKKSFGAAGETVVIEEMMSGEEVSVFVLTDGKAYKILPTAQDHKRIGDGDTGLNTGGMGAYAPASGLIDAAMMSRIEKEIIVPTLAAMDKEKSRYRGLLYVGLMMTDEGPKVVEYNCRFGDPETQAVLPLIRCDWYEAFRECASAKGNLASVKWGIDPGSCVSVVLASKGYPGKFSKGKEIKGIDAATEKEHIDVYFAGVSADKKKEKYLTNGGRVLSVTARANTLADAILLAYEGVAEIKYDGITFRRDIGAKGLKSGKPGAAKKKPPQKS